jgi:hypothetical protein
MMPVKTVQKVFKIDGAGPKKDFFFAGSYNPTQILWWNARD